MILDLSAANQFYSLFCSLFFLTRWTKRVNYFLRIKATTIMRETPCTCRILIFFLYLFADMQIRSWFWYFIITYFWSNTFGQQDSIIIRISLSKRHFRALREKSRQKVQQALKNIYFCFQEKPYLTAFKVSFAIGLVIPCSLLFLIMVSTATFFFFVYLTLFVVIGFFSSLFIIPLLGISFVFAIGVVSFGFCSNMSFKMAQLIYVRADAFLKKVLDKMALQTQPAQLQEPQEPLSTLRPVSNPTIPSPLRQTARPSKFVTEEDVIFEPVSAQSAIARSLETTANKAGNKFQLS